MTKKEEILQVASRLFAEKGFAETSAAEVAEAAGVAQGTVFYHFKTKEGILAEVFRVLVTEYHAGFEKAATAATNGLSGLEEAVRFHFSYSKEHCREFVVLVRDMPHQMLEQGGELSFLREGLRLNIAFIESVIKRGQADGSIRTGIPTLPFAEIIKGMLMGVTRNRMLKLTDLTYTTDDVVQFVRTTLAGGNRCTA